MTLNKEDLRPEALKIQAAVKTFWVPMHPVYSPCFNREILAGTVRNEDKIFSIYGQHTDILVKGKGKVQFGPKVNLATGKSRQIPVCFGTAWTGR